MANLDINHLIAQQNGGVAAERVSDAEVVQRLRALETQSQPQFARGVDLAAVRDKQYRQHRWVLIAHFSIANELVQAMAAQRQEIAEFLAQDLEVPVVDPIGLPMGNENMIDAQGPGCLKCSTLWEAPENGFGTMCPVDDREFDQQQGQVVAAMQNQRNVEMQRLVGIERAKLA